MKRRAFFGAIAAAPAAFALTAKGNTTNHVGKYGYVDVDRAQKLDLIPCDVFIDGLPVNSCVAFDDIEGWADLYVRDYSGAFEIHWHNGDASVATRRVHGAVTVQRKRKP